MKKALAIAALLALGGCDLPYNSPYRFWPPLPPELLATIEPPEPDAAPGAPQLGYFPGTSAIYRASRGSYHSHGR